MAGLQRSATTFRRSGSSGLVWDERFLSGDLGSDGQTRKDGPEDDGVVEFRELRHSQSVGSARTTTTTTTTTTNTTATDQLTRSSSLRAGERRSGFRAAAVPPAADPPSPDVSGCILCQILRKPRSSSTPAAKRPRPRKH